jgi:hypothetical protein
MMRLPTAAPERIDWKNEREKIDLAAVCTAMFGPAPGRRGERGRRLWWPCPLHEDRNPSFAVDPGKAFWRCFGCGQSGDAANLLMRLEGLTFPEAIRRLSGDDSRPARTASKAPVRPATPPPPPRPPDPSGLPREAAEAIVAAAAARLWTDEGAAGLEYLRGRGLTDETIHAAGLGFVASVSIPTAAGDRAFRASGVSIPWLGRGGRLALCKIRQAEGSRPKYAEAFRDPAASVGVYPGLGVIQAGRPLAVVEGEFDALLVGQELAEWGVSVVTLGSASARPDTALLGRMLAARPWILATDADDAGDRCASTWPSSVIRLRPPERVSDWGELHAESFNGIRYHFGRLIGPKPSVDIFVATWGPATDPAEAAALDGYDKAEREAIQAEGGIVLDDGPADRYDETSGSGTALTAPPPDPQPYEGGKRTDG